MNKNVLHPTVYKPGKEGSVIMVNNSKEYMAGLRRLADWFEEHPAFPVEEQHPSMYISFSNRGSFIAAVKAAGPGEKTMSNNLYPTVLFTPLHTGEEKIVFTIARDKVCKKVHEAVWECEPFLTAEDHKIMEN